MNASDATTVGVKNKIKFVNDMFLKQFGYIIKTFTLQKPGKASQNVNDSQSSTLRKMVRKCLRICCKKKLELTNE